MKSKRIRIYAHIVFVLSSLISQIINASYISHGDELGDIAARYGMKEQLQGIPSLTIDFDKMSNPNNAVYDQFFQTYKQNNNMHEQTINEPKSQFTLFLRNICNYVFYLQFSQHQIDSMCHSRNTNENDEFFKDIKASMCLLLERVQDQHRSLKSINESHRKFMAQKTNGSKANTL